MDMMHRGCVIFRVFEREQLPDVVDVLHDYLVPVDAGHVRAAADGCRALVGLAPRVS
jgi:hypothetical protein